MSFFDQDALDMLEVYLNETGQLVDQLNIILLDSETNHTMSSEDIQNVFRIMHTMKSSSAMMGLSGLSATTHQMEDIFERFRKQQLPFAQLDTALYDLLFDVFDFIEHELSIMEQEDYMPSDIRQLQNRAAAFYANMTQTIQEEVQPVLVDMDSFTNGGTRIRIEFEKGCRMQSVRAYMLVRQIQDLCTSLQTIPQDLDDANSSEFIEQQGFYLSVQSDQLEDVMQKLSKGLFVDNCRILEQAKPMEAERPAEKKKTLQQVHTKQLDELENMSVELLENLQALSDQLLDMGIQAQDGGPLHKLELLTNRMEHTVMKMRLVPVSQMVPRLKRILRDMCQAQKKDAELIVRCPDIEADKTVVEYLMDALMHILRNAIDHGIESPQERIAAQKKEKGHVLFEASIKNGELMIVLADDGKGIDANKVLAMAKEKGLLEKPEDTYDEKEIYRFLLIPGFTTNKEVTEYSGRGVGLDVVSHILEDIDGHLYIESELGKGTRFIMTLPLSLATVDGTRFRAGEFLFALPSRYVYRFMEYQNQTIETMDNRRYIAMDKDLLPLIDLTQAYHMHKAIGSHAVLICLKTTGHAGCILADEVLSQKRIIIKPLPFLLQGSYRRKTAINGVCLSGRGNIYASLDVDTLIENWKGGRL